MKSIFTYLLLLIVLVGTIYPCCVTDNCSSEITAAAKGQQKQTGTCSPFFACAACAGVIITQDPVSTAALSPALPVHKEALYIVRLASFATTFFQPPRNC